MVVTLAVCFVALVVLVMLAWAVLGRERTDETERFNRARQITNSWAEPGPQLRTPGDDMDTDPTDPAGGTAPTSAPRTA